MGNHNIQIIYIHSLFDKKNSLQTFAIPGSLFLSILSGFLFSFPVAICLVCLCSAVGATMCFLLSQLVGRRIVRHFFPERADQWALQVEKHKDELLSYVLFLRMTPFLPNWFINLVAPVIGVPLFPFAVGTFFGNIPKYKYIKKNKNKKLYMKFKTFLDQVSLLRRS